MASDYQFSNSQTKILSALLDRDERTMPERMVSLTVDAKRFPEYFDDEHPFGVRRWEEEVRTLASLKWIHLDLGKHSDAHRLARIRLDRSKASEISKHLSRVTLEKFYTQVEGILSHAEIDSVAEAQQATRWNAYLKNERKRLLLNPPSAASREVTLHDLELLVKSVTTLIRFRFAQKPWRQFALEVSGNSKGLEKIKGTLVRILHQLMTDDDSEENETADTESILSHFGVLLKEEVFYLRGPVSIHGIEDDRVILNGSDWCPFFCIPTSAAMSANLRFERDKIKGVITIENEESFHSWCRQKLRPDLLAFYLGGFPSLAKVNFLKRLSNKGLPVFHWGDLDCGGIEILIYLRNILGVHVQPVGMSDRILRDHSSKAQPLSKDEIRRLQKIRSKLSAGDKLLILIQAMETLNLKLEQEAVQDPLERSELLKSI